MLDEKKLILDSVFQRGRNGARQIIGKRDYLCEKYKNLKKKNKNPKNKIEK